MVSLSQIVHEKMREEPIVCTGCGVRLQIQQDQELGYIPKNKMIKYYQRHDPNFKKIDFSVMG